MKSIGFAILLALALAGNTWAAFLGSGCGSGLVPVFQFSVADDDGEGHPIVRYFMTANPVEAAWIKSGGAGPWKFMSGPNLDGSQRDYTDCAWPVGTPGTVPVARYYGDVNGTFTGVRGPNSHFFTASPAEIIGLDTTPAGAGWHREEYVFAVKLVRSDGVCHPGTKPMWRAFNNGYRPPPKKNFVNHKYPVDRRAYDAAVAAGWAPEGIAWCLPDEAQGFVIANSAPVVECGAMNRTEFRNVSVLSAASSVRIDVCTKGGRVGAVALTDEGKIYATSEARDIPTAVISIDGATPPTYLAQLMGPVATIEADSMGRIWVSRTTSPSKGPAVVVFDPKDQRVLVEIPVASGYTVRQIVFYAGHAYLAVAKDTTAVVGEVGEVKVVDIAALTVLGPIQTALTTGGLTVGNRTLYVGVRGAIQIVDLTRGLGEVVRTIPMPAGTGSPFDLAVDTELNTLWVSEQDRHSVIPLDLDDLAWGNPVDGVWQPASLAVVSRGGANHLCWVTAGSPQGTSGVFTLRCVDGTIHVLVATFATLPFPYKWQVAPLQYRYP
jgi:hypothetical protein